MYMMKRVKMIEIRKKRNMTQAKVAEKCNIARSTYAGIECGQVNPSFAVMLKIKEALKYKRDDLFLIKGENERVKGSH